MEPFLFAPFDSFLYAVDEIMVTVVGTDDVSLQPVTARHIYSAKDLAWGRRLADVLSELPDGRLQLDVRRFHDTIEAD